MLVGRKTLMVLLMLVASLNLVSCDNKANQMSVSGRYVSEKSPERFRELKSDGTFFVQEGQVSATGTYKVSDKQITLTVSNGTAFRANLEGKAMIDLDGERYTKQ